MQIVNNKSNVVYMDEFFNHYENQYIVTWRVGNQANVSEEMVKDDAVRLFSLLLKSDGPYNILMAKVIRD